METDHQERRTAKDSSGEPSISVIVPVYNGGAQFRRCLASLAQASPPPSTIVVVADGESDGSWQIAEDFDARVIKLPSRSGPAVARNAGVRSVRKNDILMFVDADVAISPNAIGEVASIFKDDPAVAALIGSYDDTPPVPNFHSQFKNLFHHYVHQTGREDASTFWGACGAIRYEVFQTVGGFDERYRQPSIEDIELGYRLKRAGHRIRLSKQLQVKHLKHWRAGSMLKADFFNRALPWTELIHRDRRFLNDLNLTYPARLSVVLVYGLVIASLAMVWWPSLFAVAGGLSLALLAVNAPLYRFFARKRGWWFALRAIPWHWFYYLYSGLAFIVGTICHLITQWRRRRSSGETAKSLPAEQQGIQADGGKSPHFDLEKCSGSSV
jgi:GT2 family glycosyltransferase